MIGWLAALFTGRVVIRLFVTAEVMQRLGAMKAKIGAEDEVDVIRHSLAVYEHLVRFRAEGYEVRVVNPDTGDSRIVVLNSRAGFPVGID